MSIDFQQTYVHLIAPSGYAPMIRQNNWQKHATALNLTVGNTHVLSRQYLRYGGTIIQRLDDFDIKKLQQLPNQSIIMPIRGGYGLGQLIEQINWQTLVELSLSKQLFWVGHSDFTLFHLIALKFGLSTYAGPMFISDLDYDSYSLLSWQSLHDQYMAFKGYFKANQLHELNLTGIDEEFNEKMIVGHLWGGNLAMLTHLIGSSYMPSIQQTTNGLLFLEDIGEHPYKIDRMLHQLYQAGYLANQQAVLLGDFSQYKLTQYDQTFTLEHVWQDWQKKLPHVKFLRNLNFGHCYDKLCLKIGQIYTINIAENTGFNQ